MDDYKIGAEKATLVTNRPAIDGSPFQSADDTWLQPDPDYPAHALDPETKKPLCPHSDPITVLPSVTVAAARHPEVPALRGGGREAPGA